MPHKINPTLAIAVPTWGRVTKRWANAYRHIGGPLGASMLELDIEGRPIAEARNTLMATAIAHGADFLFFLGDDVIPHGDVLIRLLQRLWEDPEKHLITGMYWTKGHPTQPYIWKGLQRGPYLDWRYGELFPIENAGVDCLLVRLSPEIKALGPEWFSTEWIWNGDPGEKPQPLTTEDFYFYARARAAGLTLWCDSGVQCLHEDRQTGMVYGLTNDMPQAGGQLPSLPEAKLDPDGLVLIADVGAGLDSPFFGHADSCKVIRFDGDESTAPDFRCDLRDLPANDQSFDVVHSRHVLEHFGRDESVAVLREWIRILRVGGELRVSVPNLLHAIDQIQKMDAGEIPPDRYPWWQLYGEQKTPYDYHKQGFTERKLAALLEELGCLTEITVETGDGGINLYARAIKAGHSKRFALAPAWAEIAEREAVEVVGLVETAEPVVEPDPTALEVA